MIKGWRCFLLFSLALWLTGCASQRPVGAFFFLQMADTQFGFFNDNADFTKETVNFERAIAEANRLKPSFVVVCGDLVNKPGDPGQVAEYKRIAARLDPSVKLYNVAGNHDVANIPTAATLKRYRDNFGQDHYSFEAGNIFGIVLNSSLMRDPDSARAEAAEQDRWLEATLKKASESSHHVIMVFQHHSFFISKPDEAEQYFNFPIEKRRHYLELLKAHGVRYVFAGHYHRNAAGLDGSLAMVTTGPVGKPLGKDPSGFRIVTVDGQTVEHRYYSLDSIPDHVSIR